MSSLHNRLCLLPSSVTLLSESRKDSAGTVWSCIKVNWCINTNKKVFMQSGTWQKNEKKQSGLDITKIVLAIDSFYELWVKNGGRTRLKKISIPCTYTLVCRQKYVRQSLVATEQDEHASDIMQNGFTCAKFSQDTVQL